MRDGHNLLVVSDLHLSEGRDPETGKTSRLEDFLHDDAFARLLRYHDGLKEQPRYGGRPWLLILNGDIFDFLQVVSLPRDGLALRTVKGVDRRSELSANEREFGLGTTARECEWKLRRIAKGHQGFFVALGWFVAHGNHVAVIRGNHDVELYWPEVQERFVVEAKRAYVRQTLREGAGPLLSLATCRERIRFYPWFYYEAPGIYVEHGGQYEAANHFRDFLNPVLPDDPEHIELPWGSLFVRYLFNKIEDVHPFADNVKPLTRYLSWAFRKDPVKALDVLVSRGWVFLRAVWKAGGKEITSALHAEDERAAAREEAVPLPPPVVQEIKALARRRVEGVWQSWVGTVLERLISLLTLLLVGALIVLAGAAVFVSRGPWWMAAVYIGAAMVAAWARRELGRSISRLLARNYLAEAAGELEGILEAAGGAALIVMGHDHRLAMERLERAWYVNTGTWTAVYEREGPVEGQEAPTFLRVAGGPGEAPELLRWQDWGVTRMTLWEESGKGWG